MATKYNDIIQLRSGTANYNIKNEGANDWVSFIPNDLFNDVLNTVLKSVKGNDIDNHKSFWIMGTYGTGKSHAVAVISHLLSDPVEQIREYVDIEFPGDKHKILRNSIYSLRQKKRLLPANLYGIATMTHESDLSLVVQRAVTEKLESIGLRFAIPTNFDVVIDSIENKLPELWDTLIKNYTALNSVVPDRKKLLEKLRSHDIDTYHRVVDTMREANFDVRMDNATLGQWLLEVQEELRKNTDYRGLLIIWDEFTDVMKSHIGLQVLKKLQEVTEDFNADGNDSYFFLISHPSARDKIGEEMTQTKGRYHMKTYNMEAVSAFKIMSRKFRIVDEDRHESMRNFFYSVNHHLLDLYTESSNNQEDTKNDLFNLFPLHPGTANLATHYATSVGSSSRSVFEFLGSNDAIKNFLNDENAFANRRTITADFLWDYVLSELNSNGLKYAAVTERFNTYNTKVGEMGPDYLAVFKGILLLNAFNNVAGDLNNGLITPEEKNIKNLYAGTEYGDNIDDILEWLNVNGVIQRTPAGIFSVQFSALPQADVQKKKDELINSEFSTIAKVAQFGDIIKKGFQKKFEQTINRPVSFELYSLESNASVLTNQIKNGKKAARPNALFFAFLLSCNNKQLSDTKEYVKKMAEASKTDMGLRDVIFFVFDDVFTDMSYDRFVEYQANTVLAHVHGFTDQAAAYSENSLDLVKEWFETLQRGNATLSVNDESLPLSFSKFAKTVNAAIAPKIFFYGPETHEGIRLKQHTFWANQSSKTMVQAMVHATCRSDIESKLKKMGQARPILIFLQDALDENLNWKSDINPKHPLKIVCNYINKKIKEANKAVPFNFYENFIDLTKAPFGLWQNYTSMAMVAFAMREHVNKIFDSMGKPRSADNVVDDVVELFKAFETGKGTNKLIFKFQTPEERELCNALVRLFKLSDKHNSYSDISSLKDARYAITGEYLEKKGYPIWSLNHLPDNFILPFVMNKSLKGKLETLFTNIMDICSSADAPKPEKVRETLHLCESLKFDAPNLLAAPGVFQAGFENFLMSVESVELKKEEMKEAFDYIKKHLQSSIGYWTERDVESRLKDWKLQKKATQTIHSMPVQTSAAAEPPVAHVFQADREEAIKKLNGSLDIKNLKRVLMLLCEADDSIAIKYINDNL